MLFAIFSVLIGLAPLCHAQLETGVYLRSAREYIDQFSSILQQEQEIIDLQIDEEKAKSLGVDASRERAFVEQMKAPLMYSLFEKVTGMYDHWHTTNSPFGLHGAPYEFRQSAVMIDSCYFRLLLCLAGSWEALSGQSCTSIPPSFETRKNWQSNLELAMDFLNRAQYALAHPEPTLPIELKQADLLRGLKWGDELALDSTFDIDTDLGGDRLFYYSRREPKLVGNIQVDGIRYVTYSASGLQGIEISGHSVEQRDALISMLNARYGNGIQGDPELKSGADLHLKWELNDLDAWAEIRWWNKGSPNGTKLGFKVISL